MAEDLENFIAIKDNGLHDFLCSLLRVDDLNYQPSTSLLEELPLDSLQRLELTYWLVVNGVARQRLSSEPPETIGDLHRLLAEAGDAARTPSSPALRVLQPDQPRPIKLQNDAYALCPMPYALRPIGPEVLPFLYGLATTEEISHRWRFRGVIPTFEAFQQTLSQGVVAQFAVCRRQNLEPIGHVVCYNSDQRRATAYVAAAFRPDHIGTGMPIEALGLFVDYLFQVYGFRRLHAELPSYNFTLIASGERRWFDVEGRLREVIYFDGKYWDEYIVTILPGHLTALKSADRTSQGGAP